MKKIFFFGMTATVMAMAVACSDKKEPVELPDLSTSKTFTGTSLELSYNGEQMPGKTVVVSKSGENLTMAFSCLFDLSQLTGMGLTGNIQGPGVTPGDTELTITTPVTVSGSGYSVSGTGATEYVTYKYEGSISDSKMVFNITDCKLKNASLAGSVFSPAPVEKDGLEYTSLPFHLVWEIDPVAEIDLPLSEILKVAVTAPIIPVYNNTAYMSVSEALVNLVKTVALTDGGTVRATYISTLGGAAHLATTSGPMMMYVPAEKGMKLYLNPLSVVGEVLLATSNNKNDEKFDFESMLKKSRSENVVVPGGSGDIDPALKQALVATLLKAFAPSLANGIPLTIEPTVKGADIYLDTATSVGFMSSLLKDALQNPVIAKALMEALANADISQLDPTVIQGLLQKLPQFLTATTKLEIGLSFVAVK